MSSNQDEGKSKPLHLSALTVQEILTQKLEQDQVRPWLPAELREVLAGFVPAINSRHSLIDHAEHMTITPRLIDQFMTFLKFSEYNVDFFLQAHKTPQSKELAEALATTSRKWMSLARDIMLEWNQTVVIRILPFHYQSMQAMVKQLQKHFRVHEGRDAIHITFLFTEDTPLARRKMIHWRDHLRYTQNPVFTIAFLEAGDSQLHINQYSIQYSINHAVFNEASSAHSGHMVQYGDTTWFTSNITQTQHNTLQAVLTPNTKQFGLREFALKTCDDRQQNVLQWLTHLLTLSFRGQAWLKSVSDREMPYLTNLLITNTDIRQNIFQSKHCPALRSICIRQCRIEVTDHDEHGPTASLREHLFSLAFIDCLGPVHKLDFTLFKGLRKLYLSSSKDSKLQHHLHHLNLPDHLHTFDTTHFAERHSHTEAGQTSPMRRVPETLQNLSLRWSAYGNITEDMPYLVRLKIDGYEGSAEVPGMWKAIGPQLEALVLSHSVGHESKQSTSHSADNHEDLLSDSHLADVLKLCTRLETLSLCGYFHTNMTFLTHAKQIQTLVFNPSTALTFFTQNHLSTLKELSLLRVLDLTGAFWSIPNLHWLASFTHLRGVRLSHIKLNTVPTEELGLPASKLTYVDLDMCSVGSQKLPSLLSALRPYRSSFAATPHNGLNVESHRRKKQISSMLMDVNAPFHYRAYGGTMHPEYLYLYRNLL